MINYTELTFRVEAMQLTDIEQVMEIERTAFSSPWSAASYERELVYNENAHFFVIRPQTDSAARATLAPNNGGWLKQLLRLGAPVEQARNLIIGHCGFWLVAGEAHVMTIAVRPEYRGRYAGELLLATMIENARELNATEVTLEVRVTNKAAQALYRKYGFIEVGKRLRYYSDNQEDALIMTTSPLRSSSYLRHFENLQEELRRKLART
ncbi:MAG TPA: ribosomal protein S18-alanine N-acetyltransferase [Anaerolineae bacterium]